MLKLLQPTSIVSMQDDKSVTYREEHKHTFYRAMHGLGEQCNTCPFVQSTEVCVSCYMLQLCYVISLCRVAMKALIKYLLQALTCFLVANQTIYQKALIMYHTQWITLKTTVVAHQPAPSCGKVATINVVHASY